MDDKKMREEFRQLEIKRIKLRKSAETRCPHLQGGGSYYRTSSKSAFCLLKLPTGEITGVCLYCQKSISSLNPADVKYFAMPTSMKMAESIQMLDHIPESGKKALKQLSRFSQDDKDEILGNILDFEQESNVVNGHVWVIVRPGNSSFAQYAKKHGWKRANNGGIILWIDEFEESMIKKFEYAKAFALTLNSHGITAFADERMAP